MFERTAVEVAVVLFVVVVVVLAVVVLVFNVVAYVTKIRNYQN